MKKPQPLQPFHPLPKTLSASTIPNSRGPRLSARLRLLLLLLLFLTGFFFFSCSSSPKNEEPKRPTSVEAGKFADFGNSFFNESRFSEAAEMYGLALERYLRIDDQLGAVSAYNSLAKTNLALGKAEEALRMLEAADKILNSYPSDSTETAGAAEPAQARAETFNNFGELRYALGEYREALEWFDRGIGVLSFEAEAAGYAVLLHNRGTALFSLGQIDQARESIVRALEINTEEKTLHETASNHFMLALIALEQGDSSSAAAHAEQALAIDKEVENSNGIGHDLFLLGRISHTAGQNDKALVYLDRAEQIFSSLNLPKSGEKVAEYRKKVGED